MMLFKETKMKLAAASMFVAVASACLATAAFASPEKD